MMFKICLSLLSLQLLSSLLPDTVKIAGGEKEQYNYTFHPEDD